MNDTEPSNATEEAKQPSTQPEADTDAPAAAEASNDRGHDDDASPSDGVEMKAPEVAEQDGGNAAEGEEAAQDNDSSSKAVEATDTADSDAPPAAAEADTAKENSDIANTAADAGKKADETDGGKKAGTKRKDVEFELPSVPTKVKKARTAYFMFADDKRPEVVLAVSSFLVHMFVSKVRRQADCCLGRLFFLRILCSIFICFVPKTSLCIIRTQENPSVPLPSALVNCGAS